MYPNNNNNNNPNSNPSSEQQSHHHSTTAGNQQPLTRWGSAPSSVLDSSDVFLTNSASASAGNGIHSSQTNGVDKYSSNSETRCAPGFGVGSNLTMSIARPGPSSSSSLLRHSSSPPGFLNHLIATSGFTLANGGQGFSHTQATTSHGLVHKQSRLGGSQLNFTNQVDNQSTLKRASSNSNGFSISSWENGNSVTFVANSSKRGRNDNDDLLSCFSGMDSQMELSEMGVMENMMHIPEDSIACKVRAKRGFATHPRSIAERERRTRISGKLKKLQELVPNMDKQTSYSEMLDLAIQHIAGLQFQIQKLNKEVNNCTCGGCKPKN